MEALRITDTAGCPVHSLRVDIGWITVEQAAYAVPLPDKLQGILVLQRHVLQASGYSRKASKESLHIHALDAIGLDRSAEAPANGEVISCRALDVEEPQPLVKDGPQRPLLLFGEAGPIPEALDLFRDVSVIDVLVHQEIAVIFKCRAGLDGQEFQFPHQHIRAFLDAGEEVDQIGIQIIVDIQPIWVRRQGQQHGGASAERLSVLVKLWREDRNDTGSVSFLVPHPCDRRLNHTAPPHAHRSIPAPAPVHGSQPPVRWTSP